MAAGPPGLGWSIDWLPDGRLLVTGDELAAPGAGRHDGPPRRSEPASPALGWNEIVVDGRGNVYVNSIDFDFMAGEQPKRRASSPWSRPTARPARSPTASTFPNGMVVTPDNSTLIIVGVVRRPAHRVRHRRRRQPVEPTRVGRGRRPRRHLPRRRGLHLDAIRRHAYAHRREESPEGDFIRVREGGAELERIEIDRPGFACMLGGPDRRTLFMMAAAWHGVENVDEEIANRTGRVLVAEAPTPGVGWP